MAVTVDEQYRGASAAVGGRSSAEIRYWVRGTDDLSEAHRAVEAASPDTWDIYGLGLLFLLRDNVEVIREGEDLFEGIVSYSTVEPTDSPAEFWFDTTGGQQHVTQAIQTVFKSGRPNPTPPPAFLPAPNVYDAINASLDGVEGIDIQTPALRWGFIKRWDRGLITPELRLTLHNLTGSVNSVPFQGYAAGEVLFLGASARNRLRGDVEINCQFASTPNRADLAVGDITGIVKRGWDYLWVRYADEVDEAAAAPIKRPVAVYVQEVYPYQDLNVLNALLT